MDLAGVSGDPPQAGPFGGADLDRQCRLELREDPLDRSALAERHLPDRVSEDLHRHGPGS